MVPNLIVCAGMRHVPLKVANYLPRRYFKSPFIVSNASRVNLHTCSQQNASAPNTPSQKLQPVSSSQILQSKDKPFKELTLEQKVKQAGKDATYTGVIIFGFGLTGIMFYVIGKELFSGQSPNGLYGKAHKLCMKDHKVIDALGDPVKAYGEMSSRGRRRHVSFSEFMEGSVQVMNIQFYLEGSHDKGKVFVEARQDEKGRYHLSYVVLQLNSYPRRTITVLDGRSASGAA